MEGNEPPDENARPVIENENRCESRDSNINGSVCTAELCFADDDKYKLECSKCNRYVHYDCTQLPLFQIQLFLTTGYRKFICANCIVISEYLSKLVTKMINAGESQSKCQDQDADKLRNT